MMPMRSFGRASMNFRVTSRIASTRVASWPPMVKSFVSIEPETSSPRLMTIPPGRVLACPCLAPDGEIFRQHRAGNVQHEHDVNSACLDLRETLTKLRSRESNY